ncbi:MAG: hypothetical protein A2Y10_17780 [Planctomycetes bacterium GWF2_41_51]|nr:MAG: hypothetical protein A2Y10_17780 [Planctomycetes bacterium GWF2_41_51]HBG25896.1 hypothetical protein [Phycisphaerales bacterium]
MNAQLKKHNGAMTLFIDGQPQPFTTYKPTELNDDNLFEETVKKSVKDVSDQGVNVFFVPIFFDWHANQKYDFSKMDWRIRTVLQVNPKACIVIRIQADSMAPKWWLDANPDGVCRSGVYRDRQIEPAKFATHTCPSLASDFWKTSGADAIKSLAEHVQSQNYADRIIGYLPTSYNSNEWFFRTYSNLRVTDLCPAMQNAFSEYLRLKTGTDKAFSVPDRIERDSGDLGYFYNPNPLQSRYPVVEYYNFINSLCAQTIVDVTKILRDAHFPQKIIVGTFYGYAQGLANFYWLPESGHLNLKRLMEEDGPDFTCSPLEYFSRNFKEDLSGGFCWSQSAGLDSGLIADKGYFGEDDFAPPAEMHKNWSYAEDDNEDAELMKRNFVFTLCKGQLMWWYDLHGHWFESTERINTIGQCVRIAKESVNLDRSQISEVAVVMDEQASWYVTLDERFQRAVFWENFYYSFSKIGTTVDLLLLSDITKTDMKKYKAVFFPTCFSLNDKQREVIESLKTDCRSLIFYHADGLINPDSKGDVFNESNLTDLTGINVVRTDTIFQLRLATGSSHPILKGFEDRCFGTHMEKTLNFFVKDDDAQTLGYYCGRGLPGFAVRKFDKWKSFYCAVPGIPFPLVRNIVKDAGVHIYCEDDDVVYANKSYLGIFVQGNENKKLKLPGFYKVREVFSNSSYCDKAVNEIDFKAELYHTYLFEFTETV